MTGPRHALPLGRDPSSRFLPFVLAVMVFVSVLGLTVALLFWQGTESWRQGLAGTLTVQVKPLGRPGGEVEGRAEAALALLRASGGVKRAEPVPEGEVRALLAPWLEAAGGLDGLPLPRLIDVTLAGDRPDEVAKLSRRLAAQIDGVVVEDHRAWFDRIARLTLTLEAIAFAVTGLVCFGAIAIIVVSTRTGMIIHAEIVELLHIIGARDSYIAAQFQRQAFSIALKAALVGFCAALGIIVTVGWAARHIEPGLIPEASLSLAQWAVLAATPLAIALLVALTARWTVLHRLRLML